MEILSLETGVLVMVGVCITLLVWLLRRVAKMS